MLAEHMHHLFVVDGTLFRLECVLLVLGILLEVGVGMGTCWLIGAVAAVSGDYP